MRVSGLSDLISPLPLHDIQIETLKNKFQGTVEINKSKRCLAGKKDGFWLLVTNHSEKQDQKFKLCAEEAIAPYREKEIIEEAFKEIKSFIKIEPVFVWTEDHVTAHYTIYVLAYLINRTLTIRLHDNAGDKSGESVANQFTPNNLH